MICPSCRHQNGFAASFCDECGLRLEIACPACQASNRLGAKYCQDCGHSLATPLPPAQAILNSVKSRVLDRDLPSAAGILEAERKQVTALFADIKGSMELIAHRDPEDAQQILDPVMELMMEAVHHFEGTVTQLAGDGITALFGAPTGQEDHALRGAYAAIKI